jgi:tetratricopeptide (TPR) repeat protein
LADAYTALSSAYDARGWITKALEAAERAVHLDPKNVKALTNLAARYHWANRFDEALELQREALLLDPRTGERYAGVASQYMALGEYQRAEKWVQRARERGQTAYLTLARTYLSQGRLKDALQVSKDFVALNPKSVQALGTGALVALASGDFGWAMELLERASKTNPTARYLVLASVSSLRGSALLKLNHKEEAEKLFVESIHFAEEKLQKGDEGFHSYADLAITYSLWGRKEEACKWLEKAIDGGWCWQPDVTTPVYWENIQEEDCYSKAMAKADLRVAEMRGRVAEMEKDWGWE